MTEYELEEVLNAGLELAIEHFGRNGRGGDSAEATIHLLGKLMAECMMGDDLVEAFTAKFREGLRAGVPPSS